MLEAHLCFDLTDKLVTSINAGTPTATMELEVAPISYLEADLEAETYPPQEVGVRFDMISNFSAGGTLDHDRLINKDYPDQHQIGSITGLSAALKKIDDIQIENWASIEDAYDRISIEAGRITDVNEALSGLDKSYKEEIARLDLTARGMELNVSRVTADQATTSGQVGNLYHRVTTEVSRLDVKADAITAEVSRVEEVVNDNKVFTDELDVFVKEEVARLDVKADGITANVSKVETDLSNIKVGGRNLALLSAIDYAGPDYPLATYNLSESIADQVEVTLSIKGSLGSGKTGWGLFNGLTTYMAGIFPEELGVDGVYRKTFKWKYPEGMTDNNRLLIYPMPYEVTVDSAIDWVKLELGNKATDWTPAPEDVTDKINNDVEALRIETSAQLQIAADSINQTVSQNKTTQDGINESMSSLISQNKGQIEIKFTQSKQYTDGEVQKEKERMDKYIRFGGINDPYHIELAKSENGVTSPHKTRFTESEMSILYHDNEVAEFGATGMGSPNVQAYDSIAMAKKGKAGLMWVINDAGDVSLDPKGA